MPSPFKRPGLQSSSGGPDVFLNRMDSLMIVGSCSCMIRERGFHALTGMTMKEKEGLIDE
jgi:hypothetical protein